MHPGRTGFPLCLSHLYTAVGVLAVCLSVRSSAARQRKLRVSGKAAEECTAKVRVEHFGSPEEMLTDLMAAITLVRLFSAVNPLVSVQVVALNEPHITCITSKWLFPCKQPQVWSIH